MNFMLPVFPAFWSHCFPKSISTFTKHASDDGLYFKKKWQQTHQISLRKINLKFQVEVLCSCIKLESPVVTQFPTTNLLKNKSEQNFSKLGRHLSPSEISNVMKFCCDRPNSWENITEKQGTRSLWKDPYQCFSISLLFCLWEDGKHVPSCVWGASGTFCTKPNHSMKIHPIGSLQPIRLVHDNLNKLSSLQGFTNSDNTSMGISNLLSRGGISRAPFLEHLQTRNTENLVLTHRNFEKLNATSPPSWSRREEEEARKTNVGRYVWNAPRVT